MNFVGSLIPLPCGHQAARPPDQEGRHERVCRTCHKTHTLVVAPTSEHLTHKLGTVRLTVAWETPKVEVT